MDAGPEVIQLSSLLARLLALQYAYHAMHESELMILQGTDFHCLPFIPTDKKIVQIDLRPERLGTIQKKRK